MSDMPPALREALEAPLQYFDGSSPTGRGLAPVSVAEYADRARAMAAALRWTHIPWARPTDEPKCKMALLLEGGCVVCAAIAALEQEANP